jgi:hypothetical protein
MEHCRAVYSFIDHVLCRQLICSRLALSFPDFIRLMSPSNVQLSLQLDPTSTGFALMAGGVANVAMVTGQVILATG